MLAWFQSQAPIRVKFRALTAVYGAIGSCMAVVGASAVQASPGTNALLVDSILFGGVAALMALTFVASKLICGPYVGTVLRMEALAAGDLTSPIQYTEYKDCVGRLTKAMAVFRGKMEEALIAANQQAMAEALADGLVKLSQGDLTHRISVAFPKQYEPLRSNFNAAMDELAATLSAVSDASRSVHTGASEISQASDDLASRTERQAASLEETAAAMNEITCTVREAAQSAARADQVVRVTRQEAQQSGEIVGKAVDAMSGIENSSSEISEIISVIDGIAFQTNLLALNAGIEAARAGDAGKGFAVVASEVRALALRSAEAAKDVKLRVTTSVEHVEAGVVLVNETGVALQRIVGSIEEIDSLVSSIATSAEQQATGLQHINAAVSEMDGIVQQNAAMVEQATASARTLAGEAESLAARIQRFKLRRDAALRSPDGLNSLEVAMSSRGHSRYQTPAFPRRAKR